MELDSNGKTPKTTTKNTRTTSSTTASNKKGMDFYNEDFGLLAEFEQSLHSGKTFDYSKHVKHVEQAAPEEQIKTYLSRIERGGLIQPHGCLLAIEEGTFKIISYSENCFDFLELSNHGESSQSKGLIGLDARTLFIPSSANSLEKAVAYAEFSMVNPLWIQSRSTQKPFNAILHRIDVGNLIDLEPADSSDSSFLVAGSVESQKLAVRAISELQSLPGGDISLLCNKVAEEVQKLTGYDRVMVYKFHDDQHGEVVSEIKRPDLDPYLNLHFPATDIPQAARFLLKNNRVQMICDCHAGSVRVIQSKELNEPLCLTKSTLRAPHNCHYLRMANMGCIGSLVMAVTISGTDSKKIWGLVLCHHTSPHYIPYTLRYACGFLMKAFGLQLNMEIQLENQLEEKNILRMQTLLCDLLLRDVPFSVVTQSPTIMELVKCDGAALYYKGKCWLLGVSPTETQVQDISEWLLKDYSYSTGLSTDRMIDTDYPGVSSLGDAVCGMIAARISEKDFLFWFRSHAEKEIKWGRIVHHPGKGDEGGTMPPRTSFQAFLEVVRHQSFPWEITEINIVHTLQVIMRDKLLEIKGRGDMPPGNECQKNKLDELSSITTELVKVIETASAPIFGVDSSGFINGWNSKISELTGLQSTEAMGKSLLNDIVLDDSGRSAEIIVLKALQGEENLEVELKLKKFNSMCESSDLYVLASACPSRDTSSNVVGVCFVGQDITCDKVVHDKFIRLQGDYQAIVHDLNPLIPPIFASIENVSCSEWNTAMEKLSGWARDEVIGKLLPGEIFGGLCKVIDQDALTKFRILLYHVIDGHDRESFPFGFFDREGKYVEVLLTAKKRTDESGKTIGCFCFVKTIGKQNRQGTPQKDSELIYFRREIKRPLNGIRFIHQLMENNTFAEHQKQLLGTSDACERQMISVLEDMNFSCIEEGQIELKSEEFLLSEVIDTVVTQVMILFKEKNVLLVHEIPNDIKRLSVYGDQVRLQLVLSDFLLSIAHHAPTHGWVEIRVSPAFNTMNDEDNYVQLQLRMTHPGEGFSCDLVKDIFEGGNIFMKWLTQEGLGLNMSRKILMLMNGQANYVREENRCYFLIDLKLRLSRHESVGSCGFNRSSSHNSSNPTANAESKTTSSSSTITYESGVRQLKYNEVSNQEFDQANGLLLTLRKSCVRRQAMRVESVGSRQSRGRKYSSEISSVGSSSHPGYDAGNARGSLKLKTKEVTPDSRNGNRVPLANLDKSIMVSASKKSNAGSSTTKCASKTFITKFSSEETAKSKVAQVGSSKVPRLRKANESLAAVTNTNCKTETRRYNRLGDGKEKENIRTRTATRSVFQVQKVKKPSAPLKIDKPGLIGPKEGLQPG